MGMTLLFVGVLLYFVMPLVWLIISAMAFGGVMEYTGLLSRLIQPVVDWARGDRRLVVATGLTSIGINVVAGDQYMAIVPIA